MTEGKAWEHNWIEAKALDSGGQGDTFLVKHVNGNPEQAVLKLLKESKAQNPKARRRMYQEVANLRTLATAGANVPKVFDGNTERFEELDQQLYFVMEHIGGETLDKVVNASKGLPLTTSVNIALRLCETLKIAIKEGIQHRDIKPENLMVRDLEKPDLVMLDFGLSFNKSEESGVTETDETLDNKFISLPERRGPFENKRNPLSDITSVSAILLYCLTGVAPKNLQDSQGRPPHRSNEAMLREKVKNIAQLSFLNSCLDKGLSYEIADRFQTVEELEIRLREVLTPRSFPLEEDLVIVAAREAEALFQVDARTRLAEYQKRASHLGDRLDKYIGTYRGKLGPFLLNSPDRIQRITQQARSTDVFNYTAILKVQRHNIGHEIQYYIMIESNECAVYRRTVLVRQNNFQPRKNDEPDQFGTPVLVHRYLANQSPDAGYIEKDLDAALKESMTKLRETIGTAQ